MVTSKATNRALITPSISSTWLLAAILYLLSGSAVYAQTLHIIADPQDISAWGDSLTVPFAPELQLLYNDRTIFNGGVGGQTSIQIAARQGGVIPLLTLSGDLIPSSGGVIVTMQSIHMHNRFRRDVVLGTLSGIHGSLIFDGVSTYTFLRTTNGDSVIVYPQTPFIVDTFRRNECINIFWYGRNDYSNPTQVMNSIRSSVAFLKNGNKRFVVMSILNGSYAGRESVGGRGYKIISDINALLKAEYPENYLDIRSYLVSQYDSSMQQDLIDHENDLVPSSLRKDPLHLNTRGSKLVAAAVKKFIQAKGWE